MNNADIQFIEKNTLIVQDECWLHEMIGYRIGNSMKRRSWENMIEFIKNDDKEMQGHNAIIPTFLVPWWNSIFM